MIADRRAAPRDDLMSILVHAEVDGDRLARRRHRLGVAAHPHRRRRDDPPRHHRRHVPAARRPRPAGRHCRPTAACCRLAVEEMLRWVSPIKNMARTATATSSSAVNASSAGEKLLLLYPSANRDEDVFADPFRFDITPDPERPRRLRLRHPLLPRCQPRPPRTHRRPGPAPRPSARSGPRRRHGADAPAGQLRQRLRTDARSFQPVPARMTCPSG